jgi:hypothetical protein
MRDEENALVDVPVGMSDAGTAEIGEGDWAPVGGLERITCPLN